MIWMLVACLVQMNRGDHAVVWSISMIKPYQSQGDRNGQSSAKMAQFPAQVLTEDHPAAGQFCELSGHHTFFLDARGLHVLELIEVPEIEAEDGEMIRIADWSDANVMKLTTYLPEPVGVVIRLKEVRH